MKTRFAMLLGAGLLLPVLGGCPLPGSGSTHFTNASFDGWNMTVSPGDRVIVLLRANPSTGFSWEVDTIDASMLSYVQTAFTPDDTSGATGVPGTSALEFSVTGTGSSTLTLKYVQVGAPVGTPPADTFSINIASVQ
jgi:predicted secreted protein